MTQAATRPLILASSSVYRRQLLERLCLPFSVIAPQVDETAQPNEAPAALAQRLAHAKAQAVAQTRPQAVVIGCDQVADLDGRALGKPGCHARAKSQLQAMSGKMVMFQTAVTVICLERGFAQSALASVRAHFCVLSDARIEAYLQAEQPYDCAGSAKSEGLGIALMQRIDNDDPSALIGLPLMRTCRMLEAAGIYLLPA